MLEKIDLSKKLPKKAYKAKIHKLRNRLYDLQKICRDHGIAS